LQEDIQKKSSSSYFKGFEQQPQQHNNQKIKFNIKDNDIVVTSMTDAKRIIGSEKIKITNKMT